MILPTDEATVSLDTNAFSALVSGSAKRTEFSRVLSGRQFAVTYFVRAEVRAARWEDWQRTRVESLMRTCYRLPPPDEVALLNYIDAKRMSADLDLDRGVQREDLWMLAQSQAYELTVASDDANALRVAKQLQILTITTLDSDRMDELYRQDARRLRAIRRS